MASHIWSILTKRSSLWVEWVHHYKLKGAIFWDVAQKGSMSWGWRKLLKIRDTIRPYIWKIIGNGLNTLAWSDNWCVQSPLNKFISNRNIARAGFNRNTMLADLVNDGTWTWPQAWYDLYPVLINVQVPSLSPEKNDVISWHDYMGKECCFSPSIAWKTIHYRHNEVPWVDIVWHPQCIPRHSFHLWLVFKNKLKTQDRTKHWDVGSFFNLNLMFCPLCKTGMDSHAHLFFECSYSSQVWTLIRSLVKMDDVNGKWEDIMQYLPISSHNTAESIIRKLVLAATTYFVWQEGNARLFTNDASATKLRYIITSTIRLKILTIKFKESPRNKHLSEDWKMQECALLDELVEQ